MIHIPRTTSCRVISKGLATATQRQALLPQTVDLLQTYQGLVTLGKITADDEQIRVVMQLRKLQKELRNYAPPALTTRHLQKMPADTADDDEQPWWLHHDDHTEVAGEIKALIRVRTHAEDLAELTTPKGLLLTGPPGSGKSFLVDLWLGSLPTPYKTRKHYNQLVLEVYRAVWEETKRRMASVRHSNPVLAEPPSWNRALRDRWRELVSSGSLSTKWARKTNMGFSRHISSTDQTIAFTVAQRLIIRHWLLVFDEIQLLDVSSATLLADVLSWFWRMGGVIVGTSNRVPNDLYKNGVQRDRLEPFVEALKARCPVVSMRSVHDWREARAAEGTSRSWYTVDQRSRFDETVRQVFDNPSEALGLQSLTVFGRTLRVPRATSGAAEFTFSELCQQSLGPADYISLASAFRIVVITDIPVMKLSAKNEARRFISLIDALYEARCHLICLAAAAPEDLFFPDAVHDVPHEDKLDVMMAETVGATRTAYRPNVSSYDASDVTETPTVPQHSPALETLSIFSGKDEQFAFKRALSRLLEMTSESYQRDEEWTPLPAEVRKWETPEHEEALDIRRRDSRTRTNVDNTPAHADEQADFATEAAYESQESFSSSARPEAPRLHDEHFWGIHDDWKEGPSREKRDRPRKE